MGLLLPRAAAAALLAVLASVPLPAQTTAPPPGHYASSTLRALVARLAEVNARVPDSLRGYRALVETEFAVGYRDTLAREQTTQLEQTASAVHYDRRTGYTQRVVGYRAQMVGTTLSMLSFLGGWTLPHLYGERLRVGIVPDSATVSRGERRASRRRGAAQRRDTAVTIVHPLAADRDAVYGYEGGDTVATLRINDRVIHVVRVRVRPLPAPRRELGAFEGELDVDAERHQLVRMRGKLVRLSPSRSYGGASNTARGVTAVAFIEFENAEVDGRFWLPTYQRTEMQGALPLFGDLRSVFRIVSHFRDVRADVALDSAAILAAVDSGSLQRRHRLSFAPRDSLTRFGQWTRPIGAASAEVRADDFADLAPERWRPTGRPTVELRARRTGELLRYNRVEGAYTGLATTVRLRDRAPGVELRAHAGWAWAERTMRGALSASRTRGGWTTGVRLERALVSTNDFRSSYPDASTFGALLSSIDDFDYLDRRSATLSAARATGLRRTTVWRLETGPFADRAVGMHQRRGLWIADSGFRPLRGIHPGQGWRSIASVEYHPEVSALFLRSGVGGTLRLDQAAGALRWTRLDGTLVARRELGPLLAIARVLGGIHPGRVAPQTLFELGSMEGLPGYDYKQFVGDRALVGRVLAIHTFPLLGAPIRVRRFLLPSLSPGVSAGATAGWAELASSGAARAAEALVAGTGLPVPRPTGGTRATVDLRVTLFRGAASIGVARPVDQSAPWRRVWTLGQAF